MKHLKLYENFIGEAEERKLWRNTSQYFLENLVRDGKVTAEENRFISFSLDEDSGGQDNFGDTRIEFDFNELVNNQGAREIYYEPDFFEEYPEISRYVTGYSSEQDYYDNQDYDNAEEAHEQFELAWEDNLESYEPEQEVVIKELRYVPGMIKSIFIKHPDKRVTDLLDKKGIPYSTE